MNTQHQHHTHMRTMIQAFVACIMLAVPFADVSAQQTLGRGVMSSGGVSMASTGMRMNGSVSQTTIGITRSTEHVAELGYWYTVMQGRPGYSIIIIPNIQAGVGQTFQIPVLHSTSPGLFSDGAKSFSVTFRFNKSMIEILDTVDFEETDSEYVVTLTGSTQDTVSTLASLKVRARLGNDTSSMISLDEFRWINANGIRPRLELVPGTFTTLGVCVEGGTPRLVRTVNLTSIRVYPNPADASTAIAVRLERATRARITIHDLAGALLMTVSDRDLGKGVHTFPVSVETLPSGACMVRLETPDEVLTQQLIINK